MSTDPERRPQGHYQYPQQPAQPKTDLGVTAMVCGIVGIGLSLFPILGLLSFLLGPAGVVLGILAIANDRGKAQGVAGIVTGAVGLVVAILVTILFSMYLDYSDPVFRYRW